MGPAGPRRYQFSMRSLMLVLAIVALLLVPVAWVARERERILQARAEALRAVVLAERYRVEAQRQVAGPAETGPVPVPPRAVDLRQAFPPGLTHPSTSSSTTIERLQRENADLRQTIERLRREIERLESRLR